MFNELADKVLKHIEQGEEFALVQVIGRRAPSSGKVGDKALILASGKIEGWIGGGCVKGIAIKEALQVIKTRRHRLVRISPVKEERNENEKFIEYTMTCQSKGSVDLLIEPVIPHAHLVIIGHSNIAKALGSVAKAAGFKLTAMSTNEGNNERFPHADEVYDHINLGIKKSYQHSFIVVATQGEKDEETVCSALQTDCPYVGFISSKKKAEDVKTYLGKEGKVSDERIKTLRAPVGFDINAKLPGEVAISILSEIISFYRKGDPKEGLGSRGTCCGAKQQTLPEQPSDTVFDNEAFLRDYYINPVCNVPVSKHNPKHIIEYKNEKVYFCCDGCKASFEKEPKKYIQ